MEETIETEDHYIIERVKEIVVEILELEDDFEHMEELIEQVQGIDFGEPDAFTILAGYIEQFSLRETMTMYPNLLIERRSLSNLNTTVERSPDHADIENFEIEPWASSTLRRLWRAIASDDFKDICDDGMCLSSALSVLEIMLLMVDKISHVPVASSEELKKALGAS